MNTVKSHSSCRRDVVFFGIDEYEDPLLTYYKARNSHLNSTWTLRMRSATLGLENDHIAHSARMETAWRLLT
jgi:hypothetical protein